MLFNFCRDLLMFSYEYFGVYTYYECIHVRSTPFLSFVATRLRMASFLNSLAHWLKKSFSYLWMVELLHFYFWLFALISTYHHTTHTHTDSQKNCAKAIQLSRNKVYTRYYMSQILKNHFIQCSKSMMESSVTFCCSVPLISFFLSFSVLISQRF